MPSWTATSAAALADDRVGRLDQDLDRGALVDRDERGREGVPVRRPPPDLRERPLDQRQQQLGDPRLPVGEDPAQPGNPERVRGELGLHAVPVLVDRRDLEQAVDALLQRRDLLALGGLDRLGGRSEHCLRALLPHREEELVERDEVRVEGAARIARPSADVLHARLAEALLGEDLASCVEQPPTGLSAALGDPL